MLHKVFLRLWFCICQKLKIRSKKVKTAGIIEPLVLYLTLQTGARISGPALQQEFLKFVRFEQHRNYLSLIFKCMQKIDKIILVFENRSYKRCICLFDLQRVCFFWFLR